MNITTFFFTFDVEGIYVFGDYQDPMNAQTIIKVNSECPTTKNIYPMTEENHILLGILPQENIMKRMSDNIIFIPVSMILLTFVSTIV